MNARAGRAALLKGMKSIASRDNPSYKAMAKLVASAAERRRTGMSVLDGVMLAGGGLIVAAALAVVGFVLTLVLQRWVAGT